MTGPQVTMQTPLVRHMGDRSRQAAEQVGPGRSALYSGESPRAQIRTAGSLMVCRETWVGTYDALAEALVTIGDKLHASAGAVESSDYTSADQF